LALTAVHPSTAHSAAPAQPKARRAVKSAKRAPKPTRTPADKDSKVGRYREAILKLLRRHALEPHHSADSEVIRREVAKACGVRPEKDESYVGDVSNALQSLKKAGLVERSGTVWALTRKDGAEEEHHGTAST